MDSLRPYSMSRLREYEMCPRRFHFRYVQKLPEIIESPGKFGKTVHEAIAAALKSEDWKNIIANLDFEQIPEAERMIQAAIQWSYQLGEIVGIETKFAIDEDYNLVDFDDPKAFLRGIVDLITKQPDGSLAVWDWKTGYATPKLFQIMLYAYVIQKALNRPVNRGGYILLNSNDILEYQIDEEEMDITARKLWKTIMKLEKDKSFDPKPGLCPLLKSIQAKDVPAIRTYEEAREVAREIIALEDKLKRYKRFLKDFAAQFGKPIELDSGRWELEPREYLTLKRGTDRKEAARKVLEFCQERGLDLLEFFDLKVSALESVLPDWVEKRKRLNFTFREAGKNG